MAKNPIPLTTDPDDANSPAGAIPVSIYDDTLSQRLDDLEQRIEALENEGE